MIRRGLLLLLPVLTLVSPMLLFEAPQWWSEVTASFSAESPKGEPKGGGSKDAKGAKQAAGGPVVGPYVAMDDTPVYDLGQVLRFDVSPGWVCARWPRVSAGLSQLQLQGYRVPLVTGTAEDDLAGSLTYYFNPRQQVQRLTLHGTTGNPRTLIAFVSARYGFRRRLTNDPSVFLYETLDQAGKPTSFLWIRLSPVVRASEPLDRYEVALLVERPAA